MIRCSCGNWCMDWNSDPPGLVPGFVIFLKFDSTRIGTWFGMDRNPDPPGLVPGFATLLSSPPQACVPPGPDPGFCFHPARIGFWCFLLSISYQDWSLVSLYLAVGVALSWFLLSSARGWILVFPHLTRTGPWFLSTLLWVLRCLAFALGPGPGF